MFADEFVTLQRRGDLISGRFLLEDSGHAFGAHYLADTAQVHGLRAFRIQRNDVFNRAAQISDPFRCEQHSARADVLREASKCNAFGAGTCNRERELQLKSPSTSLFHELLTNATVWRA